jgi:hypothetical protein
VETLQKTQDSEPDHWIPIDERSDRCDSCFVPTAESTLDVLPAIARESELGTLRLCRICYLIEITIRTGVSPVPY